MLYQTHLHRLGGFPAWKTIYCGRSQNEAARVAKAAEYHAIVTECHMTDVLFDNEKKPY